MISVCSAVVNIGSTGGGEGVIFFIAALKASELTDAGGGETEGSGRGGDTDGGTNSAGGVVSVGTASAKVKPFTFPARAVFPSSVSTMVFKIYTIQTDHTRILLTLGQRASNAPGFSNKNENIEFVST